MRIDVKIATREIDFGRPGDERPKKALNSCTYSRFPCSQVDDVEIYINGTSLFVARSIYADLADLTSLSLRQKNPGQFALTLNGGDASESYSVEVIFDAERIKHRILRSGEGGYILQETEYMPAPSMND